MSPPIRRAWRALQNRIHTGRAVRAGLLSAVRLERVFRRTALRASPVGRQIRELRSSRDAVIGQALGLVVDEAADQADPLPGFGGHQGVRLLMPPCAPP